MNNFKLREQHRTTEVFELVSGFGSDIFFIEKKKKTPQEEYK